MPIDKKLSYTFKDTDSKVSYDWAMAVSALVPKIDYVFTSEVYGIKFSKYLGASHVLVDLLRTQLKMSGTEIRNNLIGNWDNLTKLSQQYYTRAVVLFGTESTGKTSLFEKLKKIYPDFGFVGEYGREVVKSPDDINAATLTKILTNHAHEYEKILRSDKVPPVTILDTDWITTMGYAKMLGHAIETPKWIQNQNKNNKYYIYMPKNIPLENDGTRMGERGREKLDKVHSKLHTELAGIHKIFSFERDGGAKQFDSFLKFTPFKRSIVKTHT